MGVKTDRAAATTGIKSGVIECIKNVTTNAVSYHCFPHHTKEVGKELHEVMMSAIKTINYIKTSAAIVRLFEVFCSEMGSKHVHLLFHTEVHCLSRGWDLQRIFDLS